MGIVYVLGGDGDVLGWGVVNANELGRGDLGRTLSLISLSARIFYRTSSTSRSMSFAPYSVLY